ncbi:MAG: endonuclease [Bacteroidetes bacterium]|nr:MAG: endonuclease [Bacteroidota bacterium]
MRKSLLLVVVLLLAGQLPGQSFKLLSWNIQNLGGSKNEQELAVMVDIMANYDLVAVQEVVAKDPRGAQAVARLADALNRSGSHWDYRVSEPTRSPSSYISERYAFLWKTSSIELVGRPFLDSELAEVCYREPYIGRFRLKGDSSLFYVINFHSRRYDEQPEEEIRHFYAYPQRLGTTALLIAGDFNLDESHPVWEPLYQQGFAPALQQLPTTFKRACELNGGYFNHPIDNIYVHTGSFQLLQAGRIDFAGSCEQLSFARMISDHVPVFSELCFRRN